MFNYFISSVLCSQKLDLKQWLSDFFFQVLKHCSMSPRTIEVLLNAYSRLKVTDTWTESVPPEVLQVTFLRLKHLILGFMIQIFHFNSLLQITWAYWLIFSSHLVIMGGLKLKWMNWEIVSYGFVRLSHQEHKEFYDSVFALALTPRSLQHLARCKLRDLLQGRVHKVVPKLGLPTFIKNYLLLEYRGYIHWISCSWRKWRLVCQM